MTPDPEINAKIKLEQKSAAPKDKPIAETHFDILSRVINVVYVTRTKAVTTHTVRLKAVSPYVTHYEGRYLVRDKSLLTVETPHARLQLGEIANGFRKFFIEFEHPLKREDPPRTIVMKVDWELACQEEHPEAAMVILCPTSLLKFEVVPPQGERFLKPEWILRHHPGAHNHISIEDIPLTGNMIIWEKTDPELNLYYQIKWKWT